MAKFFDKKKKIILWSAVFLLALNIFIWEEVFALNGDNNLKVDFLDVGQGDAAFIETPQGHQILIDGGPGSAVLEKLAERMPFWDKSIDLIILTHPESDHMSGIMEVLQRYKVDYVLWSGVVRKTSEYEKFAQILEQKENSAENWLARLSFVSQNFGGLASLNSRKTNVIMAVSGEKIKAGNALIDILYPAENLSGRELKNTSNDSGIVARLVFGKNSFLFTGDISSTAENRLANSYELANAKSDVLKVAHHGSKYSTSEEFLKDVKPKIAVISVGKDNSYGHPTPEVLQRLDKFGIKTLRTDQDGDINMESDGQNIKILN